MLLSRSLLALSAFALGFVALPANALTDSWGMRVSTSTADCPSFCTNFMDFGSDGGLNSLNASTSSSTSQGASAAQGILGFAPTLQSESFSLASFQGGSFGQAFAVEGYTYNGPDGATLDLNIILTGTVIDSTPVDNDTRINAEIVFYEVQNFEFISDRGTLDFEAGATPIDETVLLLNTTTGTQANGSISIDVNDGDEFYLWVRLNTQAQRDLSSADAFSTLTLSFADATGLTNESGGISVPEPSLFALVCVAGLALAGRRRR